MCLLFLCISAFWEKRRRCLQSLKYLKNAVCENCHSREFMFAYTQTRGGGGGGGGGGGRPCSPVLHLSVTSLKKSHMNQENSITYNMCI